MVSNYSNTCTYSTPRLKDRIYVYDSSLLTLISTDNGLDYAVFTQAPTLMVGFNLSYKEETSLDERWRFSKTLTISMNDKVDVESVFDGKYYVVVEDLDGVKYLTNPDFKYKMTYSYKLGDGVNETDITLSTNSNFPLLKITVPSYSETECKTYRFTKIRSLDMIEREKASFSSSDNILRTTEPLKRIEYVGNTLTFSETFDGEKYVSLLEFSMPLKSASVSWDYDLLEFKDNLYTAVISTNDDYKILCGINLGLQPSYEISASQSEDGTYAISLREESNSPSIAVQLTDEELEGKTWDYILALEGHKTYACNMSRGCGWAESVVMAEFDALGNETARYKLEKTIYDGLFNQDDEDVDYSWYEEHFGWIRAYNVIGWFESDYPNGFFPTNECACIDPIVKCFIDSDMPSYIGFEGSGSTSYTFQSSCDWSISSVPSGITISPLSGDADTQYTITITNSSTDEREGQFILSVGNSKYYYTIGVTEERDCLENPTRFIDCNAQTVRFNIKEGCTVSVHSGYTSGLTYTIQNNVLSVYVPQNESNTERWMYLTATCCSDDVVVTINQRGYYEMWEEDGYMCVSGDEYVREARYTGVTTTQWVKTGEYRTGSLILSDSPNCRSIEKYDMVGYTCVDGNKYELYQRMVSYDNGSTWIPKPQVRLGALVEEESSFCENAQYQWRLTTEWVCMDLE